MQDEEKNSEKCYRTLPRSDCSSVQVEIQGRKRSRYLLKPRDLVAFDSSVQDEGRAEAKDVSQQRVELHQKKKHTPKLTAHTGQTHHVEN